MKRILSAVLAAAVLAAALMTCGCSKPPELEDVRGELEALIGASAEINDIFFGAGLPVYDRDTASGDGSAAFDEAEQAMRFDFGWTDPSVDRWFYPVHELSLPRESLEGARMIEFEVKAAQDKVENDFVCQNLMLVYADRAMEARVLPYNPPIGKWERRYVALDDGMHLAEVKAIRLGANPKGMKCTFWIRNLAIFRGKGK